MRHFHDLYAMKHCHMANGHPRRKIRKFPDGGGQAFPDGGPPVLSPPPVAPRLPLNNFAHLSPNFYRVKRAKFGLDVRHHSSLTALISEQSNLSVPK